MAGCVKTLGNFHSGVLRMDALHHPPDLCIQTLHAVFKVVHQGVYHGDHQEAEESRCHQATNDRNRHGASETGVGVARAGRHRAAVEEQGAVAGQRIEGLEAADGKVRSAVEVARMIASI